MSDALNSSKRTRFEEQEQEHDGQPSALEVNDSRPSLLTSRSTSSLPALVNYALLATASLSKRPAIRMQRGSSQQSRPASAASPHLEDQRSAPVHRRNSFSSFLSTKYGPKRKAMPATKPFELNKQMTTVAEMNDSVASTSDDSTKFRKGHRPRSYSDRIPQMLHPVERAPPVAITNKTPIYEYYGFVMYLASYVALGIYLIWAYVPDEILHSLGITYYPKRYWALAVPIWLMTLVWFIFISFMSINLMNTAPFDSYSCFTDEHANIMRLDSCQLDEDQPDDWMPELHDIPISVVNAVLYPAPGTGNKNDDYLSSEDGSLTIRRRTVGKRTAL